MLTNFRKTFFPRQNEMQKAINFVEQVQRAQIKFLNEQGLNEEDIDLLYDLEEHETKHLRSFESYVSRVSLLKDRIIKIDEVKRDLQIWRDR